MVLLQQRGLLAHDTRFDIMFDPRDFLSRIWNLWDGRVDMGRVQNQSVGYLFPLGPYYWITDLLGIPVWISERLWMALLLSSAFWGTARLADELSIGTPLTRVVAAASYALSPFFIARVGNTSFFVIGAALLPWVLIPLAAGTKAGSPRRAAFRSGLAIVAMGAINAVVTLAVLIVPVLWLVSRERGPRRTALMRWWIVAVAFATAWWFFPLVFQGRYGIDFLPLTERAGLTTGPTAPFEVLRGTADWLLRLVSDVPALPSGEAFVTSRPLIAISGLVAALGLFGLARRDMPERSFHIVTFLCGFAVITAAYGGSFGNPVSDSVREFLDGPGAALRNVYKFQPVVMLPLAMGVAHGAAVLLAGAQRLRPSRHDLAGAACLVLIGALVLGNAQPMFDNELLNAKPFKEVPSWWVESSHYLDTVSGRTLLVPGLPNADFNWGYTAEEPLFWLTDQPWATRSLVPLGTYSAIRYLDAVEDVVASGGDTALIDFLQRGGVSTVLVRNDDNGTLYGAPSPTAVSESLVASGLARAASFGPVVKHEHGPAGEDLRAIDIYAVPPGSGADHRVASYTAADAAVVSGDEASPLALDGWNLADRALLLAEDMSPSTTLPGQWIVTDGHRRRAIGFGATRNNKGYVLAADEPVPGGTQLYPDDLAQHETVAVRNGITAVTASTYGSVFVALPEWAPGRAVDGDPSTAWAPAIEAPLAHQFLRVDLVRPVSAPSIDVRLFHPSGQPGAVEVLRLTTAAGVTVTPVDSERDVQTLAMPQGETSWVRIEFAFVDGVPQRAGISELSIPGITTDARLETPAELRDEFADASLPMPDYVFRRDVTNPLSGAETNPEPSLRRRFVVPRAGMVQAEAKVRAVPSAEALALLDSTPTFGVETSSTFRSLPQLAPRNLVDGDDNSIWVSGLRDDGVTIDVEPLVTLRWSEPRAIDSVIVRAPDPYPQPRAVRITVGGAVQVVALSSTGEGSFPPVVTNQVAVDFVLPPARVFPLDTPEVTTMRIGLSTLEFPAVRDLQPGPVDPRDRVTLSCDKGPSLVLGGARRAFAVDASLEDVLRARPVIASPCDNAPLTLTAGPNDLDAIGGSAPFVISDVHLADVASRAAPSTSPPRTATVVAWSNEDRRVAVGAGDATYLAVNENVSQGWQARMNGHVLESVVLDGWRQGYLVPPGEAGVVELRYVPTAPYRLGLVLGLLLVGALIAGCFMRGRVQDLPPASARQGLQGWMTVPVLALTLVIGGFPAALVAFVAWRFFDAGRRDPSVLVAAVMIAATIGAALPLRFDDTELWKPFGSAVTALTVAAVAALAATALPPTARRRR
jgi:arabinofuranan 3-O-arabinosyltransferase